MKKILCSTVAVAVLMSSQAFASGIIGGKQNGLGAGGYLPNPGMIFTGPKVIFTPQPAIGSSGAPSTSIVKLPGSPVNINIPKNVYIPNSQANFQIPAGPQKLPLTGTGNVSNPSATITLPKGIFLPQQITLPSIKPVTLPSNFGVSSGPSVSPINATGVIGGSQNGLAAGGYIPHPEITPAVTPPSISPPTVSSTSITPINATGVIGGSQNGLGAGGYIPHPDVLLPVALPDPVSQNLTQIVAAPNAVAVPASGL